MIRVTVETPEINVGKTCPGGDNWVPNYWVVKMIDDVVRAMDAATTAQSYKVRENLIEALSKEQK